MVNFTETVFFIWNSLKPARIGKNRMKDYTMIHSGYLPNCVHILHKWIGERGYLPAYVYLNKYCKRYAYRA